MNFSISTTGTFYKNNVVNVPEDGYDIEIGVSGRDYVIQDPTQYTEYRGTIIIHLRNIGNSVRPYFTYNDLTDSYSNGSMLVNMGGATYDQTGWWEYRTHDGDWTRITNNRIDYNNRYEYYPNDISFTVTIKNIAILKQGDTEHTNAQQWLEAGAYLSNELIENVANYSGERSEEEIPDNTTNYYMYNTYANGVGSYDGFNKTGTDTIRNINLYTSGKNNVALYYNSSDNTLNLIANDENIYQSYHGDGSSYYDDRTTIYYRTFYNYWQNLIGNTIGASRVDTNIPIFQTLSSAQDYIDGVIDESSAINFDDVSGGINPQNKTGLQEIQTLFSDTYHTGVFGLQFACNISSLREIANAIYTNDNDVFNNIKRGLEMYGSDIISSIIDLSYYPFDITSVITNTVSQDHINFGAYRLGLTNSINRIVYSNGYINCGSTPFYPTYKNWIDYSHVGLEVYLPYVGVKQLDPTHYMNHTINVRYYIDFHTRTCTACILADDLLVDYFNGNIGISQPITAINFSEYATQTMQTLVSGVSGGAGGLVGGLTGGYAGAVKGGIDIDTALATTTFDIMTNRPQNHMTTKGTVGADTGGHMPQYVFFRFSYNDPIEPKALKTLYGKPSNVSGTISSFGGFLKVSTVELDCGRATSSEKNEIISLLKSGIRI